MIQNKPIKHDHGPRKERNKSIVEKLALYKRLIYIYFLNQN